MASLYVHSIFFCALVMVLDAVSAPQSRGSFFARQSTLSNEDAQDRPLITPTANDTISQEYWNTAQATLEQARLSTTLQVTQVSEYLQESNTSKAWRFKELEELNQPYPTRLAATLFYMLSEHETTNLPSQDVVNQEFVSPCPMVIFSNYIVIRPPRCGNSMGTWSDEKNRTLLRWWRSSSGTVNFKVDSRVFGNGSVDFATLHPQASLSTAKYQLSNCFGSQRYGIEEQVTKLSQGTDLLTETSDPSKAFYIQYFVTWPNGSDVAQTNLFRMNANAVNATKDSSQTTVGAATRKGNWKASEWSECTANTREWTVNFTTSNDSNEVATVQDLRVAMATMITLMASRDEGRNQETAFTNNGGERHAFFTFILVWLIVIVTILAFGALVWAFQSSPYADRARLFFIRLEHALLPKRSFKSRTPVFHPTW